MGRLRLRLLALTAAVVCAACAFNSVAVAAQNVVPRNTTSCRNLRSPLWSEAEQWVWSRLCVGKTADLKKFGHHNYEAVTARFIREIIFEDPFASAASGPIDINNAKFVESVDLSNAVLNRPLWLDHCEFDRSVDLSGADAGDVSFQNSRFSRGLDLSFSRLSSSIDVSGAIVDGRFDISFASVGQSVSIRRAKIMSVAAEQLHVVLTVDARNATVSRFDAFGLDTGKSAVFDDGVLGDVDLVSAQIHGSLSFQGATARTIDADGIAVDGHVLLRRNSDREAKNNATFGVVNFDSAMVGGNFEVNGASVRELSINGIDVKKSVFVREHARLGSIDFGASHIGLDFDMTGATVEGNALGFNTQVGTDATLDGAMLGAVNLDHAQIGGLLSVHDASVSGLSNFARIATGQNVEILNGKLASVNLTGARIGGDLIVASGDGALWRDGAVLSLRNASAHGIDDRHKVCGLRCQDAWPKYVDLNGFVYQVIGADAETYLSRGPDDMADRDIKWWKGWLAKEPYSPQPFSQLAGVLRQDGRPEMATSIAFAGRDGELSVTPPSFDYVLLWLDRWLIGYGYRPYYAAVWAAAFVILGVLVLRSSGERKRLIETGGAADAFEDHGLIYSFDMLIPVIKLREYEKAVELRGWARRYFYVHKIVGFILASFLLAGLAGLTK